MIAFSRGDIVLVEFPFTDASGSKRRPAVVISTDDYNQGSPDVLIASITGNLNAIPHLGDRVLSDWRSANLLAPSLAQTKLATIENGRIIRKLGTLSARDFEAFEQGLKKALGF